MTANQIKGKGFGGALGYNLEKMNRELAEMLDTNFANVAQKSILQEVGMIRSLRPNLQKYFYHTSINFPPDEDLSNEKMVSIARNYLVQNGFNQHQYILFRHYDADHPHLHLLVNRIGFDGRVVSDSQDYARSEQILRGLEIKYRLTRVISSKQALERAMTKNELEMMKRTGEPSTKMKLQVLVKLMLEQNPTVKGFIGSLKERGISLQFNQASTGFVSGVSYEYEGMVFKGSHLGNAYKWPTIKNIINYEQERDRATIYKANLGTKSSHSADGLGESTSHGPGNPDMAQQKRGQALRGRTQNQTQPGTAVHGVVSPGSKHPVSVKGSGIKPKGDASSAQSKSEVASQPAILDSHLIRDLFRPDHHDSSDDMAQEVNFRKKRRRGR